MKLASALSQSDNEDTREHNIGHRASSWASRPHDLATPFVKESVLLRALETSYVMLVLASKEIVARNAACGLQRSIMSREE